MKISAACHVLVIVFLYKVTKNVFLVMLSVMGVPDRLKMSAFCAKES